MPDLFFFTSSKSARACKERTGVQRVHAVQERVVCKATAGFFSTTFFIRIDDDKLIGVVMIQWLLVLYCEEISLYSIQQCEPQLLTTDEKKHENQKR